MPHKWRCHVNDIHLAKSIKSGHSSLWFGGFCFFAGGNRKISICYLYPKVLKHQCSGISKSWLLFKCRNKWWHCHKEFTLQLGLRTKHGCREIRVKRGSDAPLEVEIKSSVGWIWTKAVSSSVICDACWHWICSLKLFIQMVKAE